MQSHRIPLDKTGYFPKLFLDYVNQDKKLRSFYKYSPSIESFANAIKDISSQKFNRKLLVDVITEQYTKGNCQLPTANCQLLIKDDTFTVCTGHQLCLFTGPLYFIYKIISTINLAEQLKKKYPASNFIPVYWMASEDHDFEEVNHINIFGKKIEWEKNTVGRQQLAVGSMKTDTIKNVIDELKSILGNSENARELLELFGNAYLKHPDLSFATRYLVNELFGKYGLVIIDANDKRLKNEMKEIFSDEIENQISFKLVSKTIQELEKQGYKAQVNPREINLFLLKENDRVGIEAPPHPPAGRAVGAKVLPFGEDLGGAISPNVVTRPLYQQKILPNLAYIGGTAEIAYWLEYKAMFEHYKILFPVLIPRNSVMLVDASISEKLTKLGLSPEDAFLPAEEMTKKFIKFISGEKISLNSEKEQIGKLYHDISNTVSLVDMSLVSSVKAGLQKHLEEMENLEKKMLRAFKRRNEASVGQIEKIKSKLFPNGMLQERHESFIPWYLKHGKNFIDELKRNLKPLDLRFTILTEK